MLKNTQQKQRKKKKKERKYKLTPSEPYTEAMDPTR